MRREITDEQLNELFTRTVKTASPDFATATLTRLKSLDTNEKLDLMLDDLLEDHPVVASQWFTDKTITAIQRQKRVGSGFSAAILRLAAIAAVCTLSAWTLLRPEIERGPTFDYPPVQVAESTRTIPLHTQSAPSLPTAVFQPQATPVNATPAQLFDQTSLRLISILNDLQAPIEGNWDSSPLETLAILTLQ